MNVNNGNDLFLEMLYALKHPEALNELFELEYSIERRQEKEREAAARKKLTDDDWQLLETIYNDSILNYSKYVEGYPSQLQLLANAGLIIGRRQRDGSIHFCLTKDGIERATPLKRAELAKMEIANTLERKKNKRTQRPARL